MSDREDKSTLEVNGIAVVGMSARFPGARNVDEFWRNLVEARESITLFSREELLEDGIAPELLEDPNFVRARGLMDEPEGFDASFFGCSAREAALMDPQQRVFLETCWSALEAAGHVPGRFDGTIGVWGGLSTGMKNNTYLLSNLHGNPAASSPEDTLPVMLGNENDYLTTRVSYKLGLRGPSVNVQTACSTSLVAIAQAYLSLSTYGCDLALAGGVSVSYPQKDGYVFQEGGIGSPDGHCRPFDARAQGTVFSNGVGVVVLKRLEDAISDRNTIYAVIRGAATNNDGSAKMSFAAPSVDGQAEVIAVAQTIAGVTPREISYIECHGTATPIGDPIEVAALTRVFREGTDNVGFCAVGSVKSNFGHLDAAAGVAGFIKTVLALYHRVIPATLHYERPNPEIDFARSPFYVAARTAPWSSDVGPRRAGVSAFGIGGTNAHVVLEEAPPLPTEGTAPEGPFVLPVSARTNQSLEENLGRLASFLEANDCDIADVAHTLQTGREEFGQRSGLVCRGLEHARRLLSEDQRARLPRRQALPGGPSVAFLLPGGGSQYIGMARTLYEREPLFRVATDEGLELFESREGIDLRRVWFADGPASKADLSFERPSLQLPAVFILEMSLYRLWKAHGVEPAALLGHSLGENTAACIAGVLSYEDALGLVTLRGKLFETVPPGGMLSVASSAQEVRRYLEPTLDIAAINGATQCTVSGDLESLKRLEEALKRDDIEYQNIPIAIAAHSRLLEPILPAFHSYLDGVELRPPRIPIVSNVSGTWLTDAEAISPDYWTKHLRSTVRFADALSELLRKDDRILLEIGPGKILGSLAKLQDPKFSQRVVSSLRHQDDQVDDLEYFQARLADLWLNGARVRWTTCDHPAVRRIPLPTYAFQRKPYLIEPVRRSSTHDPVPPQSAAAPAPPPEVHPTHFEAVSTPTQFAPDAESLETSRQSSDVFVPRTRRDLILEKLCLIIQEMSGLEADDLKVDRSFLEMGFDSLFLTEANLRFKKEFKVKITFRQLFDDAPCLDALARYIDNQLPEDALSEELERSQRTVAPAAPESIAGGETPAGSLAPIPVSIPPQGTQYSSLLQALTLQTQASAALLQALAAGGRAEGLAPAAAGVAASPAASPASIVAKDARETPSGESAERAPAPKALGPYKPIDKDSGGLDGAARTALEQFCREYSERTRRSKTLANEQRAVLSDARSISGFRRDWKEIIYQIAAGEGSKGSRVWDLDGNEYVDLTSGFGINLFGYSPQWAVDAAKAQLERGFELGTLSPLAREAAELIHELTGMDRTTFTNTGSEALSAAVRAARTTTGKDRIAVFYDEYHGIADELLVNCLDVKGSRRTIPTSPGIPRFIVENVLVLKWDDEDLCETIRQHADDLAAVIIEPVQNRNPAHKTFRHFDAIRQVTRENDIALIFDEMITGFRLAPGGAQEYFGVEADIVCYGKILSGGMPMAAVTGRGPYLDCFDGGPWRFGDDSFPEAGVTFFGGTFTRHPVSLATAVAALREVKRMGHEGYRQLNERARQFANRLNELLVSRAFPARIENCETVFNLKFETSDPFSRLIFWQLRHRGVLIYDRPFFIATTHSDEDFEFVLRTFADSIDFLQRSGIVRATSTDGRSDSERLVPFNQSQTEIFLVTRFYGQSASRAYHEQVIYDLPGPVDLAAMRHAVQRVAQRHEGLRARVDPKAPGWIIAPAAHVPVTLRDLSTLSQAEQEREQDRFLRHEVVADFDLTTGPLVRFTLLKRSTDHHVLVIAAHHILIDGWSMGVVLKDLAQYYTAACNSERFGATAADTLTSAVDEEREYLASEEYADNEAFWLGQYRGAVPNALELPLDYQRPAEKTYNGERQEIRMDADLHRSLLAFCTEHKVTTFTAMYAAFSLLLAELTGQSDIVVGVPVAGQALTGQPELVGHNVSFLPFRTRVEPTQTFDEVLQQTRDYVLDVNDYQRYTYGSLLTKLRVKRDPSQVPLVSVTFNVDQGMETFEFNGVPGRYVVCPRSAVKHDLFVNIVIAHDALSIEVDHNSDLLEAHTVRGWINRYLDLVRQMIERPRSTLVSPRVDGVRPEPSAPRSGATPSDLALTSAVGGAEMRLGIDRSPDDASTGNRGKETR